MAASGPAVLALLRAYRPRGLLAAPPASQLAYGVNLVLQSAGFELRAAGAAAERPESVCGSEGEEGDPSAGWDATPGVYTFLYSPPAPPPSKPGTAGTPRAEGGRRAGQQGKQEQQEQQGQGRMVVMIKCVCVDDTLMVDAVVQPSDHTSTASPPASASLDSVYHTELKVPDHVTDAGAREGEGSSSSSGYASLYSNLDGLVASVGSSIAGPILDQLVKGSSSGSDSGRGGGQEQASSTAQPSRQSQAEEAEEAGVGRVEGVHPLREGPGLLYPPVPVVPGFDDLHPGGGAGVFRPSRTGVIPGGSMLVGPDDPRWGLGRPSYGGLQDPSFGGFGGEGGYPGRGSLPPGARFDPYGPPGMPGFEPGRFGDDGGPHRGFQGGGGGGGVHRDLQFRPQ